MIILEIADAKTGKVTTVNQSLHDAKKLYLALREFFGDIQYQAQPGELISVPDAKLKIVKNS